MTLYQLYRRLAGYPAAVAAPSAVTVVAVGIAHFVSIPDIALLYLPAILVTAVYFGTGPSLVAATVAAVEYDFFLLRPLFTFTIGQLQDILAWVIFLIVAVLTSQLAAGARARAEAAQRRARESTTLYELGHALMSTHDVREALNAIAERIADAFDVDYCGIVVPSLESHLHPVAERGRQGPRDRASRATVAWVLQRGTEVSVPAGDGNRRQGVYVPLRTAERVVGVMEIGAKRSGETLDAEEHRLVTSFAAQAALVIARAQSEEERHRFALVEESDRLKSALLSAVSHDLRTPLASIKASATSLLLPDAAWTRDEGRDLLETIDHEADRLNRLVSNLLDLSRIEAGVLRPVLDWYDVGEVIDLLLPRLRPLLGSRPFRLDLQPGIPPVQLDLLRIEELLLNLVENAVKYTPADTPIELGVRYGAAGLSLAVVDHGPGVPEGQRRRIFDTFYRGRQHSDRNPGTGLGLAICRGIAEAHGGAIRVEETPGGGATFVLTLPPSCLGADVTA